MTPRLSIAVGLMLAASALLSGCERNAYAANGGLQLTGSKYCSPFKTNAATGTAALNAALADPAGAFDDCIHRWGYTLAPARDPADVVAQAAVDACGPIISAWSQQSANQQPAEPPTRYSSRAQQQQAAQQPSPQAQQIRMAEAKALFYVVQARAAGCAPPPSDSLLTGNPAPAG